MLSWSPVQGFHLDLLCLSFLNLLYRYLNFPSGHRKYAYFLVLAPIPVEMHSRQDRFIIWLIRIAEGRNIETRDTESR